MVCLVLILRQYLNMRSIMKRYLLFAILVIFAISCTEDTTTGTNPISSGSFDSSDYTEEDFLNEVKSKTFTSNAGSSTSVEIIFSDDGQSLTYDGHTYIFEELVGSGLAIYNYIDGNDTLGIINFEVNENYVKASILSNGYLEVEGTLS